MKLRICTGLLISSFLMAASVQAQSFMSADGTATFTSRVPMHTFTGTSRHLTGQIDLSKKTVDFYIDLTTLDTGNKKRDKDMLITLETDTYPFAEFFGALVTEFDQSNWATQQVKVVGDFKIHGVTRQVEIEGEMQLTTEGLRVVAFWTLNLNDFDIVPPSLLVMKVDEVQEIRIETMLAPVNS